ATYNELHPRLSPDGRWLAYVSNESGRNEVYMQPYPSLDRKIQLSDEGGYQPIWSPDGKTIFYRSGVNMMAVDVSGTGNSISASRPRTVFSESIGYGKGFRHWGYDIAPDGRFLVTPVESEFFPREIDVTFGLFEELAKSGI
ncbi:MAG: hypothetical protein R3338_08455, partial [Thermoanaerobaculia bacterium]|nr:hypothetical protein [Thermoanaerobaculia bacterium]